MSVFTRNGSRHECLAVRESREHGYRREAVEGLFEDVCRMCGGAPQVEAMTSSQSLARLTASSISLLTGFAFCSRPKKKSARGRFSQDYELAEEEGFEPSLPGLRVKRFSRPPHSTTLPPLRIWDEAATVFADGHGRSRRFVQRFDHAAFCKPASHSVFMAERRGFEPRIRFWRIHDFQSCSFGQLGHLSASPSCAPSSDEAAAK